MLRPVGAAASGPAWHTPAGNFHAQTGTISCLPHLDSCTAAGAMPSSRCCIIQPQDTSVWEASPEFKIHPESERIHTHTHTDTYTAPQKDTPTGRGWKEKKRLTDVVPEQGNLLNCCPDNIFNAFYFLSRVFLYESIRTRLLASPLGLVKVIGVGHRWPSERVIATAFMTQRRAYTDARAQSARKGFVNSFSGIK